MSASDTRRPVIGNISLPPSSTSRRVFPIKRADAEPLTREDIQYDLLEAIFNDRHAVFTHQSPEKKSLCVPRKLTFCELYSLTIIASPRCSKVLREKMAETPEFAIDFAKIGLLANVGRINTTMAFFPEMRTVLRSYHPIPSLQKTDANLQDAPRIKNCLKACLLPGEISNPPSTPADIYAKAQSGTIPTTSIVNLIFVLSNHSISVSKMHFDPSFDFLDLFLPVNVSSSSRARAFLWLMFHYLESPSEPNPFSDESADKHPEKIPKLVMLTPRQRSLENVDTEEEIEYGRRMAQYRSKFLQKQIEDEEKDRAMLGSHGVIKAKFRITTPSGPSGQPIRRKIRDEPPGKQQEAENFHMSYSSPLHVNVDQTPVGTHLHRQQGSCVRCSPPSTPDAFQETRYERGPPILGERTMLEHAWHMAITTDPLLCSDEEVGDEHVKRDYERRVHVLNTRVRCKELTPEPQGIEG